MLDTINLSILDFKYGKTADNSTTLWPINLSILDFKYTIPKVAEDLLYL